MESEYWSPGAECLRLASKKLPCPRWESGSFCLLLSPFRKVLIQWSCWKGWHRQRRRLLCLAHEVAWDGFRGSCSQSCRQMSLSSRSTKMRRRNQRSWDWSYHLHQCKDSLALGYDVQSLCLGWLASRRQAASNSTLLSARVAFQSLKERRIGQLGMLERQNKCMCFHGTQRHQNQDIWWRLDDRWHRRLASGSLLRQSLLTVSCRA